MYGIMVVVDKTEAGFYVADDEPLTRDATMATYETEAEAEAEAKWISDAWGVIMVFVVKVS